MFSCETCETFMYTAIFRAPPWMFLSCVILSLFSELILQSSHYFRFSYRHQKHEWCLRRSEGWKLFIGIQYYSCVDSLLPILEHWLTDFFNFGILLILPTNEIHEYRELSSQWKSAAIWVNYFSAGNETHECWNIH